MRAVAGSGRSRDLPPSDLDRHLEMLSRLVGCAHPTPNALTLILRTADSSPAKALMAMQGDLARAGVSARAILAKLEPEADLRQLFAALSNLAPHEPPASLMRWARNARLHDAHEQAVYGDHMCWSGDVMRRDAERRNGLTLFDEAPNNVRLAHHAFAALWAASAPVPGRYLRGDVTPRPLGEYTRLAETPVAVSPLRPGPQGWPLVRH
ncbi:MAG: hypothetical protein ACOYB4_02910 [Methyloceanibacter sp.]